MNRVYMKSYREEYENPHARERRYAREDVVGHLIFCAAKNLEAETRETDTGLAIVTWENSPAGDTITYVSSMNRAESDQSVTISSPSQRFLRALKPLEGRFDPETVTELSFIIGPLAPSANSDCHEVRCWVTADEDAGWLWLRYDDFDTMAREGGLYESEKAPNLALTRLRILGWKAIEKLFG